jgi:hypothetical protein
MVECRRCGQCCKGCPMLYFFEGLAFCGIYDTRLGYKFEDRVCTERKKLKKNFAGCPYNEKTNKKSMVETRV